MFKVFDNYLLQPEKHGKYNQFVFEESDKDRQTPRLNFFIPQEIYNDKFIAVNTDKLKQDLFIKLGGNFVNSSSADFVLIDFNDLQSIKLYVIELGPHSGNDLRDKFNSSIRMISYLVSISLHKNNNWQFNFQYIFLNYKHSSNKAKMRSTVIKKHDKYKYFSCNSQDCYLSHINNAYLTNFNYNSIDLIGLSN